MPVLLYLFLGGALSFLSAWTLFAPLLVLLFFLFSLSLSFKYFYWWFFASASETNRSSLTEFLLQQGQGRVFSEGEGKGNSKL